MENLVLRLGPLVWFIGRDAFGRPSLSLNHRIRVGPGFDARGAGISVAWESWRVRPFIGFRWPVLNIGRIVIEVES